MQYEFRLPDLGEGVTEGEITEWLIEVGQEVREDEPMVEVETDKATVEIACPVDGVVAVLHAAAGERLAVGSPLVTFEEEDREEMAAAPGARAPAAPGAHAVRPAAVPPASAVRATPVARRMAGELGVELGLVVGTGP